MAQALEQNRILICNSCEVGLVHRNDSETLWDLDGVPDVRLIVSAISLSCQTANYVCSDSKLSTDITRLGRDAGWKPNENRWLQNKICCYACTETSATYFHNDALARLCFNRHVLAGLRRCQDFTIRNLCNKCAMKTEYCSRGCMSNKEVKSIRRTFSNSQLSTHLVLSKSFNP